MYAMNPMDMDPLPPPPPEEPSTPMDNPSFIPPSTPPMASTHTMVLTQPKADEGNSITIRGKSAQGRDASCFYRCCTVNKSSLTYNADTGEVVLYKEQGTSCCPNTAYELQHIQDLSGAATHHSRSAALLLYALISFVVAAALIVWHVVITQVDGADFDHIEDLDYPLDNILLYVGIFFVLVYLVFMYLYFKSQTVYVGVFMKGVPRYIPCFGFHDVSVYLKSEERQKGRDFVQRLMEGIRAANPVAMPPSSETQQSTATRPAYVDTIV